MADVVLAGGPLEDGAEDVPLALGQLVEHLSVGLAFVSELSRGVVDVDRAFMGRGLLGHLALEGDLLAHVDSGYFVFPP